MPLEEGSKVMIRDERRRLGAAVALLLGLGLAAPVQGLQIEDGDFIGVFVKGGTEVIVNLGPATPGGEVDLAPALFAGEPFNGSLADVKFVGLAVEDPDRTVNVPGFGVFPQENIVYTTLVESPMPEDSQIELAMNSVDQASPGAVAWFNLLRQLAGTTSETVAITDSFSYTVVLSAFGQDTIGANMPFSTAGMLDSNEQLTITIHSAVRGYESFGGPATEWTPLSQLVIDGTAVSFQAVPEAPAALGTLAGAATLGFAARRRRRFAD